jgi:hypothetical protein
MEASNMHPANTYFHFSFANYYDPEKMNFGALRVINDDKVKPNSGFDTHPHQNMEIFSYVVEGNLTHRDSAGNHEVLGRGHVQTVTAGTGLTHSEMNERNDWCRFLQIWVTPQEYNTPIKYELHKYTLEERHNKLLHIVSGTNSGSPAPLGIGQDFNAYVSELTDKNKRVSFSLDDDRQAYIFCFEGSVDIDGYPTLNENDSLQVIDEANLEFSLASEAVHFIILEMKKEN